MSRIFGFDVGTTSVGFAVVDWDERREEGRIQQMGVRIFPEGVEPVGGGKSTAPRNQKRRAARLVRRQIRRRKRRRRELGAELAGAGLLPPFDPAKESNWNQVMAADPYVLRSRGLSEKLEPHQIGRALYHQVKRRVFRGRSEAEAGEEREEAKKEREKEEKGVKAEIKNLRDRMAERTLGSFLAEVPDDQKKRSRHIGRDMVEEEFDALWAAQARHHPDLLTDHLRERVREVAFHQRPVFWRLKTLGKCRYEPDSPLSLKGSWHGQRFLMLQRMNNLCFAYGNRRPLDQEERALVLGLLEAQASATFGSIRRTLKPLWKERGVPLDAKFNFEVSGTGPKKDKTEVPGNATEAALRAVFGERWEGLPARERIRREIAERLREIDYRRIGNKRIEIRPEREVAEQRKKFVAEAQADYGITEEEAGKLSEIRLPQGWLRLSVAATGKLLPPMEEGRMYGVLINDEAFLAEAFPNRLALKGEGEDRLPSHTKEMPDLRNPTVARALTELRKVTNNLLAVYGKPDPIRIELARDLKLSKKQKEARDKQQRAQESKRKEAKKNLEENGFADPSRDDIEKWLLWKECKETCPYTGKRVGFDGVFRRGEFTVEHIWPRSRSLDNSLANKTLCETDFNIHVKGNKTPFEVFQNDPEKWEEVRTRLRSLGLPEAKVRRFCKESFDEAGTEEFAERQLADTGYAAREARKFLARLYGEDGLYRVQPTNGRVTAQLRHYWGLDAILNPGGGKKQRDNHRHHAVDALATALATPVFVKRLSDYYAREKTGRKPELPKPWPTLRDDAEKATRAIVVSHRARRKVSGPLHAETYLGDTGEEVVKNRVTYRRFVTRKRLDDITASQIEDIRDPRIRELVKDHVAAHGGDPKKAFPPYPKLKSKDGKERDIRRVRIYVDQQFDLMVPIRPDRKTFTDTGENHHMAIFRREDGKVRHEIVSRFEAARRLASKEPVVRRASPDGGKFVMSLSPGDTLEFPNEGGPPDYRVVNSVWANGQIVLQEHTEAGNKVWKPVSATLLRMGARKVAVDPIGRVRPAND